MTSEFNNAPQVTDRIGILSSPETLEFHPAAALFPMMERAEFQKLADDIKAHGLLEPISLYQGLVLDGRNRLEACKLVGVDPKFDHIDNLSSPTVYVVSKNLHRRHLTVGQRSAIGVEMLPLLREEARLRQLAGLKRGLASPLRSEDHNGTEGGRSDQIAAEAVGVGEATVRRAARVQREDPETFERIKSGELGPSEALKEIADKSSRASVAPAAPSPSKQDGIRAAAHKRRMEEGLSMIGGACDALNTLNLTAIASILSTEEVMTWIKKAQGAREDLSIFIRAIRKEAV